MRAQQKQRRRVPLAGKLGNQIHELDLAPRGVVGECLSGYIPAGAAELVLDVTPGFLDGLRSRRARPEVDQALDVSQGFVPGDLLPNFRCARLCNRSREQEKWNLCCKRNRRPNVHRLDSSKVLTRKTP